MRSKIILFMAITAAFQTKAMIRRTFSTNSQVSFYMKKRLRCKSDLTQSWNQLTEEFCNPNPTKVEVALAVPVGITSSLLGLPIALGCWGLGLVPAALTAYKLNIDGIFATTGLFVGGAGSSLLVAARIGGKPGVKALLGTTAALVAYGYFGPDLTNKKK